jgi:hypothetical protein
MPEKPLWAAPSVAETRQNSVRSNGNSPNVIVVVPFEPGAVVTTAAGGWSGAVPISNR